MLEPDDCGRPRPVSGPYFIAGRCFRNALIFHVLALSLVLSGCGAEMNALDPRGPAAGSIATLWWVMFWTALIVHIVVIGLLLYATVRGYRRRAVEEPQRLHENRFVAIGGVVMPAVVLLGILIITALTGRALATMARTPSFSIDVIGHQFCWEVRYPDQQFSSANEIHIPVGQPVELRLTSADVIHSLWVPELHGKFDLMTGATTTLVFNADQPGVYQGLCAEFFGIQHAQMYFQVIAEPQDVRDDLLGEAKAFIQRQRRYLHPLSIPQTQEDSVHWSLSCQYRTGTGSSSLP